MQFVNFRSGLNYEFSIPSSIDIHKELTKNSKQLIISELGKIVAN